MRFLRWAALLAALVQAAGAAPRIATAQAGAPPADPPRADVAEDFEAMPVGTFRRIESALGPLDSAVGESMTPASMLVILDMTTRGGDSGKLVRLLAGEDGARVTVTLTLATPAQRGETLAFRSRRVSERPDFEFTVSAVGADGTRSELALSAVLGTEQLEPYVLELPEGALEVAFKLVTGGRIGVLLDDLERRAARPMTLDAVELAHVSAPVVAERALHVATLHLRTSGAIEPLRLAGVRLRTADERVTPTALELRFDGRTHAGDAVSADGAGEAPRWWWIPCERTLAPGPLAIEVHARFCPVGLSGLAIAPNAQLQCEIVLAGGDAHVATPGRSASGVVSEVLVERAEGLVVDSTALGAVGVRLGARGTLVGAVGLVDGEGRASVRVLHWTLDDEHSSFDVAHDADLHRPTILADRLGRRILLAVEARPRGAAPEVPSVLLALRSSDGGATFASPEPLEIVDDDGVGRIGGHVRLGGGRGVVDTSGAWALPILRSHGHPKVAAALLVSKDEGRSWSVSSGVLPGARAVAAVGLGENSILLDAARGPSALRDESATLNLGVWWNDTLATTRPDRPASPAGTSYVHIGRETGWGPDSRLVLATAPDVRNVGLSLRGSNDYGAIWPESRRRVVDEREGAGAPAIALVDEKRLVLLFRSGAGELLLQVHDVGDYGAPLQSVGDLFGPR